MTQATAHIPGSAEDFLSKVQPMNLKPGDVDLIGQARAILAQHCNNDPAKMQAFDNDNNISVAKNLTTEIQRYKLNMFLNTQYSALSGNISTHYGNILRTGTASDWLKMFSTYHAPTMVRLGLPVSI